MNPKPVTNKQGFYLARLGRVRSFSDRSAHSGKPITAGGIRVAVPGAPGLCIVLLPVEARQLSAQRKQELFEAARAWRDRFDVGGSPPEPPQTRGRKDKTPGPEPTPEGNPDAVEVTPPEAEPTPDGAASSQPKNTPQKRGRKDKAPEDSL